MCSINKVQPDISFLVNFSLYSAAGGRRRMVRCNKLFTIMSQSLSIWGLRAQSFISVTIPCIFSFLETGGDHITIREMMRETNSELYHKKSLVSQSHAVNLFFSQGRYHCITPSSQYKKAPPKKWVWSSLGRAAFA